MRYWLMKAEPDDVSIDTLATLPQQTVGWYGVRNYQARNFMRDLMRVGDQALFYHSGVRPPGIAGIVEVCSTAYPDPTQFEAGHRYFDPAARVEQPRWWQVDVRLLHKTRYVTLDDLRAQSALASMRVLQRGNRLSITPVTPEEWQFLQTLL